MFIRKAKIEDFDEILKIQIQLENIESTFDNNLKTQCYETEQGKEKLKRRIKDKNNLFYVMINQENSVIAFLDGTAPDDEWWYKEKVAYINHLCVEKNYRKQGIATKLLHHFELEIKKKGIKHIRLLAFPNNKPAIAFYKKNGFCEYSIYYEKDNIN